MTLHADVFLGDEDERRWLIESDFSDKFESRMDENNWFQHLARPGHGAKKPEI
jgi:hypothetical protein